MNYGVNVLTANATLSASGSGEVVAADSTNKVFLTGWNLNVNAGQNAILYEYGTGSVVLDRLNGNASYTAVSNKDLTIPKEIGSGSSVYVAVDGAATVSAGVQYFKIDG